MELHFLSAAAVGIALMAVSPESGEARTEGPTSLLGTAVFATETRIDRWGEPVRADDIRLEALGTIEDVLAGPHGGEGVLLVSVGGLWGWGSQQVEVALDRVHLLPTAAGGQRLVVDLSADGAVPVPG